MQFETKAGRLRDYLQRRVYSGCQAEQKQLPHQDSISEAREGGEARNGRAK